MTNDPLMVEQHLECRWIGEKFRLLHQHFYYGDIKSVSEYSAHKFNLMMRHNNNFRDKWSARVIFLCCMI
jgi:hypothetical protein